jgi:hypothetical protein
MSPFQVSTSILMQTLPTAKSRLPFVVLCVFLLAGLLVHYENSFSYVPHVPAKHRDDKWPWALVRRRVLDRLVSIQQRADATTVGTIAKAPRALVYLTSKTSVPARVGERQFLEAADRLAMIYGIAGIQFYLLEEDNPVCRKWLASLNAPIDAVSSAQSGFSLGNGPLIWLANGQVVASEEPISILTVDKIVAQSLRAWHRQ